MRNNSMQSSMRSNSMKNNSMKNNSMKNDLSSKYSKMGSNLYTPAKPEPVSLSPQEKQEAVFRTLRKKSTRSSKSTTSSSDNEQSLSPQEQQEAFSNLRFTAGQFIHQQNKGVRFQDYYKPGPLLGTGGFGQVYRCTHIATGHERAAKIVPKSQVKHHNKSIQTEFQFLSKLDHPNLIKTYEFFEDDHDFCIVTDLYEGGDLFDLVQKKGPLPEQDVAVILQRLLACIHYCHEHNIVHRDLKLENVLLVNENDYHTVKLIDFGLAKESVKDKRLYDIVGSVSYISPQICEGAYGRGCDLWAIGCIGYVLLCGHLPFEGDTDQEIVDKIKNRSLHFYHEAFEPVDPGCINLIHHLLAYTEEERPTAEQALQHYWLQDHMMKVIAKDSLRSSLKKDIRGALKAMRRFTSRDCKLKQATAALIAHGFILDQHRERIDLVFGALDWDCHGSLRIRDLHSGFADHLNVKLTREELVDQIMPQINFGGSGEVTYSEFAAILALEGRSSCPSLAIVQEVFQYLDGEKKGYISAENLQSRLQLDPSCSRMMIAEVTSEQVIYPEAFESALLGSTGQVQAKSWSKKMGKFVDKLTK